MDYTVTVLEWSGIQRYIFASNRLSEAVGGSHLVENELLKTIHDALDRLAAPAAKDWDKSGVTLGIIQPNPAYTSEILYIGGGNAAFVTKNAELSKEIVKYVSSRLAASAPGLVLNAAHACHVSIRVALKTALEKARDKKESGALGVRRDGLGVTRPCSTTGGAAAWHIPQDTTNRDQWLSAAAIARRRAGDIAQKRVNDALTKAPDKDLRAYKYTNDIEKLGGREGEAHIAVIHCDGNQIGKRISAILNNEKSNDATAIRDLRGLSVAVRKAGEVALDKMTNVLLENLNDLTSPSGGDLTLNYDDRTHQGIVPLRRIVAGGDDVTWVCDARIGFALAKIYLDEFTQHEFGGEKFSACAGIAICRTSFPLIRAYNAADSACKEAKKEAHANTGTSWIDFRIVLSGIAGETTAENTRHKGPYCFDGTPPQGVDVSWQTFIERLAWLSDKLKRTQAKALYDAVVRGDDAQKATIQQLVLRLRNDKKSVPNWFEASTTPFYDMLSAFDFYLPVQE